MYKGRHSFPRASWLLERRTAPESLSYVSRFVLFAYFCKMARLLRLAAVEQLLRLQPFEQFVQPNRAGDCSCSWLVLAKLLLLASRLLQLRPGRD
jgi:hypothetical protein